jgi:hypothetical protein
MFAGGQSVKREQVKQLIVEAFSSIERPGNWALRASSEGDEPYLVERAFQDKPDWRTLDASFLDEAPNGYASALSFLSDEAFRYFLPAYMIADLDERLDRVDPVFHVCHGLDDETRTRTINPRRYGSRTWEDERRYRFSTFTRDESRAIVEYLRCRAADDEVERNTIEQAITNYWSARAA